MERHNIESHGQGDPSSITRRIIREHLGHRNVRIATVYQAVCSELEHHVLGPPSLHLVQEMVQEESPRSLVDQSAFRRVGRSNGDVAAPIAALRARRKHLQRKSSPLS